MKLVILVALLAGVAALDIESLLDTTFHDVKGNAVTLDDIRGKYIALYFSASWCGPCRRFTPTLTKVYNQLKAEGKDFEVIWVTADRYESSADDFFQKMPWVRMSWVDAKANWYSLFGLTQQRYIPAITILDPDFNVINPQARYEVENADNFPWRK